MNIEIKREHVNRVIGLPYKWQIHYGRFFMAVTQADMALFMLGGPFNETEEDTTDVLYDDGFFTIDRRTKKMVLTIKGKDLQTAILKRLVAIDDRIHYRKDLPL